jgi:hypothetical protein
MSNKKACGLIFAILILFSVLSMPKIQNMRDSNQETSTPWKWRTEYMLTFNEHNYSVTSEIANDIDKKIGAVSYHGNNPGSFYLYSIRNINDYSKIAIETKDGYLIAIIDK